MTAAHDTLRAVVSRCVQENGAIYVVPTVAHLGELIRGLVQGLPNVEYVEQLDEIDNGTSEGFRESCDRYEVFAFSAKIGERLYYITVEDVTIKQEPS